MATASNATTSAGEAAGNNVPQWKRDLIQRRRQQSKVLATGGSGNGNGSGGNGIANANAVSSSGFFSRGPACGAIVPTGASVAVAGTDDGSTVACNMRLEADFSSFCSDSEDVTNGTSSKSSTLDMERKSEERGDEPETDVDPAPVGCEERVGCGRSRSRTKRELPTGKFNMKSGNSTREETRTMRNKIVAGNDNNDDEDNDDNDVASEESDSSEELQYGPGIVNKLKSKYLNLALKEMNKSRVSVQRFRRAASLEDLLDCDDEPGEKNRRKYTKRATGNAIGSGGSTVVVKTDRYRNVSRGNESMKRARSVETLLRYNGTVDETTGRAVSSVGSRRDSMINDHIVLIDRTTVKIESRLGESERPKPVNKPKRIKPLLAETERPPPDLVKTTMRIFEGSARKLKPKGEVAAKVATFKTINDTFKAQAQKKLIPKPPIQPKPFVNGNTSGPIRSGSVGSVSPKKIVLPQKPTAELIETREGQREYHIDGVITDPIAQSVSSVVSKFRQIEKSHSSPSPSPEPSFKLRFSPAPSPEPLTQQPCKSRSSSLEISVKSPPVTPVLSPRISSPRLQSPSSPIKDVLGQTSPRVRSPTSPIKEPFRRNTSSPIRKLPPSPSRTEILGQQQTSASETGKLPSPTVRPQTEHSANVSDADVTEQQRSPDRLRSGFVEREVLEENSAHNEDEDVEEIDAPRTISKAALENIARTGVTMQFSFSDKPISDKSYLPGFKQNGRIECREKIEQKERTDEPESDDRIETESSSLPVELSRGKSFLSGDSANESDVTVIGTDRESVCRLQERLEADTFDEKIEKDRGKEEATPNRDARTNEKSSVKPIGAICSLGLIKSSTTTSYSQGNESKTIRCQKTESPPQKQIGIIRPLVSTKTQHAQQNLSNRELEKNLINRVKSIEQPTKVVVSLKSADEIQPAKKSSSAGAGLWEAKPWNQQNNTMVFNFSNRKDVPDYIENDGLIVKKKREKPKVGDGGIIVLDATLDASTTDDVEWELTGGPPSPCDVSFFNDNVLINGRSNLSRTPRNHKHRIQFDDTATRTFEYPSEASMLEGESCTDGETSGSGEQSPPISNKTSSTGCSAAMPTLLGGGSSGGLANYTPSKVDLTSEGFELGVTRAVSSTPSPTSTSTSTSTSISTSSPSPPLLSSSLSPSPSPTARSRTENEPTEIDYLKPAQDAAAWGSETTGDLLY
ncbi:uncharacterized protein LOC108626356 [Ceratina calcarata]|uniref:Uncharacterized protein LOC108626356 n=1 Tax=Ceratina calcarata TaxID=156304 RepID=A0AAJ7J2F1_9HYME|nr:uncharacterized protein LOC108626356 [Ceratina calcarata]